MTDFKQVFSEKEKLRRLIDKYNECVTEFYSPTRSNTDKVGGGSRVGSRTERLYERKDELLREITDKILFIHSVKMEYLRQIEQLQSDDQQDVMYQRYVLGRKFTEIAQDRETGLRRVYKLHGAALEKLREIQKGDEGLKDDKIS